MKRITAIALAVLLSGCSAISPVDLLTGSKPDISAQAGAENVKQAVGITAKKDSSSKQENTFKESKVEKVDTSSKKTVKASTIQANTINAEKIQVVQGDNGRWYDPIIVCFATFAVMLAIYFWTNKKEA
ncbi:Rz-like spanin [Escherichia phage MatMar]